MKLDALIKLQKMRDNDGLDIQDSAIKKVSCSKVAGSLSRRIPSLSSKHYPLEGRKQKTFSAENHGLPAIDANINKNFSKVNTMKSYSDKFAIDRASVRRTDENGYMHVGASHITKATVNPYYGREIPGWEESGLDSDKIYYGLRDPEELQESLPTWAGLPLHIEHHIDSADDPQKLTRVGTVGTEIKWNPPYVDAPLSVWDQKAIDGINDGSFRELSCAYRYEPDFTSGEYEGQKYDFIMRKIRGNHVALVQEGRAGKDVLVADGAIKLPVEQPTTRKETTMGKIRNWFRGAKDADPEIEQKEVDLAQAIIDLHRVDPKTGEVMETDGDLEKIAELKVVIEGIKDKLSPDELQKLTDAVNNMAVKPEVVDNAEVQEGTMDEENKIGEEQAPIEAEKAEDELEEAIEKEEVADSEEEMVEATDEEEDKPVTDKDPMEIITAILPDLTDEQKEKLQAAFATIAGEDEAEVEEATDEDPEAEDEEPEEKPEAAQDKALKRKSRFAGARDAAIKAQAKSEVMGEIRDLYAATQRVRPLVGEINPLAFDSASNVYGYALEQLGYNPKKYERKAWRGMVDAIISERSRAEIEMKSPFAKDSKSIPDTGHFAGLSKISLGY